MIALGEINWSDLRVHVCVCVCIFEPSDTAVMFVNSLL